MSFTIRHRVAVLTILSFWMSMEGMIGKQMWGTRFVSLVCDHVFILVMVSWVYFNIVKVNKVKSRHELLPKVRLGLCLLSVQLQSDCLAGKGISISMPPSSASSCSAAIHDSEN